MEAPGEYSRGDRGAKNMSPKTLVSTGSRKLALESHAAIVKLCSYGSLLNLRDDADQTPFAAARAACVLCSTELAGPNITRDITRDLRARSGGVNHA